MCPIILTSGYLLPPKYAIRLSCPVLTWFLVDIQLPNPHYLPELCIKVTLLNFTVTKSGLEDQLLDQVIAKEQPVVDGDRKRLV